jgi:hypothetical protein
VFRTGPQPRLAGAALLAALLAVLTIASAARAATVTVTATPSGRPVAHGFLGISTQYKALEAYTGSDPGAIDPAFVHLLGDIAPGQSPVLRIGGESADWSWYPVAHEKRPPGVNYTITNKWLQVARATAQDLRAKLILDINLEAGSRPDAVGEANAMLKRIGRRNILAMEIGNEPELYHHFAWYHTPAGVPVAGRPASWSLPEYRAQFSQFAHAMPQVPIAGPVSGLGIWLQSLGAFLHDEPSVGLTTIHAYPLKHCAAGHHVTIPELLSSASSAGFVREVAPYVNISHADGKPIRIDEVNAITCGGTAGVSNSFASALWVLNTMFGLAHTGVDGVNFNTVPHSINSILNPVFARDSPAIAVQPEWYAMMMFAQAAPPGSQIMHLQAQLPPGLEAWATRTPSGTIHVVLINKNPHGSEPVTLNVPAAAGPATLERLQGHGLASTRDVRLGGQTFGDATSTGLLIGDPSSEIVSPVAGGYTLQVPGASAAMLTFTPPPEPLLMATLRTPGLFGSLLSSW